MFLERVSYFLRKVRHASTEGTLQEKVSRKMRSMAYVPTKVSYDFLKLSGDDRRISLDEGFADHRKSPQHLTATDESLKRIIAAYKAAKEKQEEAPTAFQVRGLWAEGIAVNFGKLIEALKSEDIAALREILDNFNREEFAIGTGAGYDDYVKYTNSPMSGVYLKSVWCGYRDLLYSLDVDLSQVSYPMIGNPVGVKLDGALIPIETLRHAYNGKAISTLLRNVPEPVVLEIGGGLGGQAYQAIRLAEQPISKYLLFDIPEVLAVCSYFILTAFPDMKVRLFGEGKVSADKSEDYSIGLFPHFTIDSVEDMSVDMVFNSNSFSEMDGHTSGTYLSIVNRVCRKYFMHINHEVTLQFHYPDGTKSVNLIGSKMVPDREHFKRLYKRPRIFMRPEDKPFPSYTHLYERMN
jgi:putative sugar O-methyltransferase